MTLSTLFPKWYMSKTVLDPKRIRTSWNQFKGLHKLTPARFTAEAVEKERDRLLKTLSASTVRRSLADIAVFGQWLHKQKHIHNKVEWDLPAESKPRQRWLTATEMKLMLETSRRTDVPLWFDQGLHLSFLTGQRISAILGLRWDQIEGDVIDFNFGVDPRSKRRGIIPVTAAIAVILKECEGNSPLVLGPVTYTEFLNEWYRVCGLCGIEGATPHTLRHTVATQLVAKGIPILEVSRMLGHSNTVITERVYAKFAPEFTRRASEEMGRMMA